MYTEAEVICMCTECFLCTKYEIDWVICVQRFGCSFYNGFVLSFFVQAGEHAFPGSN